MEFSDFQCIKVCIQSEVCRSRHLEKGLPGMTKKGSMKNSNCKVIRKLRPNVPVYFHEPTRASMYHSTAQLLESSGKGLNYDTVAELLLVWVVTVDGYSYSI